MVGVRHVTPHVLEDRLAYLAKVLAGREEALGLLALGSIAAQQPRLDGWSDLDFFVLVRNGAKAHFIENTDWLAAAYPVVWHYRNSHDGRKALMGDGVFCEYAIFETHELHRIPFSPGRFVWRRDEVDESLALPRVPLPGKHGVDWLIGEALSSLLVGLQRHARGEKLAAMRMVQVHALDRVLELLELVQPSSSPLPTERDPFNVDRRIELRHPQLAELLPTLAGGYQSTVPSALSILSVLEQLQVVPTVVGEHIRELATAQEHML